MVSRQRISAGVAEEAIDALLSGADEAMVNAFTTGFRVTQVQAAISKALPDAGAVTAALESAQVVALGILVREQMDPAQFASIYRPFATVLPGPTYLYMPHMSGLQFAKALSEKPKAPAAVGAGAAVNVIAAPVALDPAANYTAAWKHVIGMANQTARTQAFRVMQDSAEQAAPHDGLGIVGFAGVAAGAIFMRDVLPIEKVLLLYEPFGSAFPYEALG